MFHLTETVRIDRPSAEVWATLIDFPNVPAWEDGVLEVRPTSGDRACQVTYSVNGEMRPLLVWLTPLIAAMGRRLVRKNLAALRRLVEATA